MKKIIILLFCWNHLSAFAQDIPKIDSVYYVISSAKTSNKDTMWKFNYDEPIMYCVLQCPCLKNNEMPILSYKKGINKVIINEDKLRLYHLTNLPDLIIKCKAALTNEKGKKYAFFLIEPFRKKYIIHSAKLSQTQTVN